MFLPDSDWDTKVRKTSWKKGGLHSAFERERGKKKKQSGKECHSTFQRDPLK